MNLGITVDVTVSNQNGATYTSTVAVSTAFDVRRFKVGVSRDFDVCSTVAEVTTRDARSRSTTCVLLHSGQGVDASSGRLSARNRTAI